MSGAFDYPTRQELDEQPPPLFVPVNHSRKLECRVCGKRGFAAHGEGWQRGCLIGHAACPDCGKQLALGLSGKPRKHFRCPRVTGVARDAE